ncbi:hypothetical protein BGZ65_002893, partial [Modicella reniformis]
LADNEFSVRPIRLEESTKWVCEECYELLSAKRSIPVDHLVFLKEYTLLTRQTTEVEVTLRCSTSVILFKGAVEGNSQLRKAILHIKSGYFQTRERRFGAQYHAIQKQFIELGEALRKQHLTSLEIHVDHEYGNVFAGLQHVLKCAYLKTLRVVGVPAFLGVGFQNKTNKLEQLVLDGVHIDTKEAATNFATLLKTNPVLKSLHLSRSCLTIEAVSILIWNEGVKSCFSKLSELNLSNNDFCADTARSLISMALQGEKLTLLDLSDNQRICSTGRGKLMELLRTRDRVVVSFNDRTFTRGYPPPDCSEKRLPNYETEDKDTEAQNLPSEIKSTGALGFDTRSSGRCCKVLLDGQTSRESGDGGRDDVAILRVRDNFHGSDPESLSDVRGYSSCQVGGISRLGNKKMESLQSRPHFNARSSIHTLRCCMLRECLIFLKVNSNGTYKLKQLKLDGVHLDTQGAVTLVIKPLRTNSVLASTTDIRSDHDP